MKNKGFTLIELLGVIIILALLMIIVFPSIINSVKNSSNKTDDLTKELIYNAADLFIDEHINDFSKTDGNKYLINLTTLVDEGLLIGPIKLSGSDIDIANNMCIQVTYNEGYKYELKEKGTCEMKSVCTLKDLDGDGEASLSDKVTCGTENFYVMYSDNDNITMLSMYLLNASVSESLKIQNSDLTGEKNTTGTLDFAHSKYWSDTVASYPAFVYSESNLAMYPLISEYERVLKENLNVSSAKATLISYEQLVDLGCSIDSGVCLNAPSWVYSSTYWTGSAYNEKQGFYVSKNGDFTKGTYDLSSRGLRPVVIISTSEV